LFRFFNARKEVTLMLQNYTQEVWKTENKFKFTMLDMIPELTGLIDIQWASLFEIFFKRNAQYDMFFFRDTLKVLKGSIYYQSVLAYAAQHELPDKHGIISSSNATSVLFIRRGAQITQYKIKGKVTDEQIYQQFNINYIWSNDL